jgi:ectoine hydroxylase-related dioxygenase (phytanoyl-CoA dioxygenase family)
MNDRDAVSFSTTLARGGFAHIAGAISGGRTAFYRSLIEDGPALRAGLRHGDLPRSALCALGTDDELSGLAATVLENATLLVRAIVFDKSDAANWGVPWHQDRSIAVCNRASVDGYGAWARRFGYWQVEPPAEMLDHIVTLRVHLDDSGPQSGPLLVRPGSHRLGRLTQAAITALPRSPAAVECLALEGDIVAMKPLIVHSSRKAGNPTRRRVLHLEFATCNLPAPLEWALD